MTPLSSFSANAWHPRLHSLLGFASSLWPNFSEPEGSSKLFEPWPHERGLRPQPRWSSCSAPGAQVAVGGGLPRRSSDRNRLDLHGHLRKLKDQTPFIRMLGHHDDFQSQPTSRVFILSCWCTLEMGGSR